MKIIDLTDEYINYVIEQNNFESYEKSSPQLFSHYYQFWSKRNSEKIFNKKDILYSKKMILSLLPQIENNFLKQRISLKKLNIILFVGMGNTNGHAFDYQGKMTVWIPVETYKNEIDTEVFITHEIAHALHYEMTKDFYFTNNDEKNHIGRQLITEGVATYFSQQVLDIPDKVALWGNYLDNITQDRWMTSCNENFIQIKTILKISFDSSDSSLGLFYANDINDIFNFRCGYYAGLKLVEQIAKTHQLSLIDLIEVPRTSFHKHMKSFL